jgi:alpha-beta hydrolase superfamily lysophospholipase
MADGWRGGADPQLLGGAAMKLEVISKEPPVKSRDTEVLFVHGFWHAAWHWDEGFMDRFTAQGYKVHALSLRGHGESEGRDKIRWWSVKDYVQDITDVYQRFEKPPVLVGGSAGGGYVQKFLETHSPPAAVLIGSVPSVGLMGTTLRFASRHPLAFLKVNLAFDMWQVIATPELYREMAFSDALPEQELLDFYARAQNESYRAYFDLMLLNTPKPNRVSTPMLVVGSDADQIVSVKETERTARDYHADIEMLHGIGHLMTNDVGWEAVADRILAWLDARGL